ncbi:MAG: NAD(P)-dependent oxidoreductase [Cyanobacteria bacterium P01_H01_bin.119]
MPFKTIAVLGLGAMGLRLAQNILSAGYSLVVYNRTADKAKSLIEQGARSVATPKEAAAQADIVISMVTDDAASQALWMEPKTGAIAGLKPGVVAVESSTLTVDWVTALSAAVTAQSAAFLDAPVVGSRPQAEAGKLMYLIGGEKSTLAQIYEVLAVNGSPYHVGGVGQGMAMKLAVNALFGIQVAAVAELLGLLTQAGLDPSAALPCLSDLPVTSPAAKGAAHLMVNQNHAPLFPLTLAEKDLGYALTAAKHLGADLPTTRAVRDLFREAIAQGYGAENLTAIAKCYLKG